MHMSVDLRLKCPFSAIVSGPSNCGKTTFVANLLQKKDKIFTHYETGKCFWFYKVYQPIYDQLLEKGIVHQFIQGLCTMEWMQKNASKNDTVIIDDLANEVTSDTPQLFTVGSHHYFCNIIFLTQNLFPKNKFFRDMSLNATYIILFKNVRDKLQITNFGKQFAPGNTKRFSKIFYEATKQPHSYLMIDNHQETCEDHRLISNFLEENNSPIQIYSYD